MWLRVLDSGLGLTCVEIVNKFFIVVHMGARGKTRAKWAPYAFSSDLLRTSARYREKDCLEPACSRVIDAYTSLSDLTLS